MAVGISVSCCCWVAVDCEMRTPFLLQVTVVAGPPEEMQVRVLDKKSCSIEVIIGAPVCTRQVKHIILYILHTHVPSPLLYIPANKVTL